MPFEKGNKINLGKKYSRQRIIKILESRKWYQHSDETKQKISKSHMGLKYPDRKRIKLSPQHKAHISKSLLGKTKGKIQGPRSLLTKQKISQKMTGVEKSIETRHKMSLARKGKNNNFWRGGVAIKNKTERQLFMSTFEYKLWRESVFKRDNYACQQCGKRGGNLNADHIKPFRTFPNLRLKVENGRTLCADCHRRTNTWGIYDLSKRLRNNKGQFI